MKITRLSTAVLLLLLGCSGQKETVNIPAPSIYDFTNTISSEGIRADLVVLSHDSLEGRETGTPGLEKAATFLTEKYTTLGLEPAGDGGSFYQEVKLNQPITNSYTFKVHSANEEVFDESSHNANEIGNFINWAAGKLEQNGEIIFAGYGVKNDSVNQYPLDMEGKWLLVFYEQANFVTLQNEIAEKNASGALLILNTDEASFITRAEGGREGFGFPGSLSLTYLTDEESSGEVVNIVNPSFAAQLLGLEGVEGLEVLKSKISLEPEGFEAIETGFSLEYKQNAEPRRVESKNILAFIEGTDPILKDEVVVLSSHYDHFGIGAPDSTGDAIYNGADDDGSGTVGILHVAQALMNAKKAGAGTKRSVLILHVTGEEKGLLGSRFYSDHPVYSIEKTVANLNVDMIGRRDFEHPEDGDYIYIIGGKIISSGLAGLLEEANRESVNITLNDRYNDLNDPNQFYRRSDHWNFGRLGVPFIFFFNGVHEDYHRPSDEVEKIDFEALTKRTKLIFTTTVKIANAEERPKVDNQEFILKTQEQPR